MIKKGVRYILNKFTRIDDKYGGELQFWRDTLAKYVEWYRGGEPLYGETAPTQKQKVIVSNEKDSAILTWSKVHQEKKYLKDLKLNKNAFKGKRLLDIGSGPHPSALVFNDCSVYCLDPLLPQYFQVGFPMHYYDRAKFVQAYSENIPMPDNYFDAIISVNAIDHVDDIEITSKEIKRVLKKDGKLRMHIHYHKKTREEPIELNDQIVIRVFSWCKGFKKISESTKKTGSEVVNKDERYALWSN